MMYGVQGIPPLLLLASYMLIWLLFCPHTQKANSYCVSVTNIHIHIYIKFLLGVMIVGLVTIPYPSDVRSSTVV